MTRPRRPRPLTAVGPAANPLDADGGPVWHGHTPTGEELERMPRAAFHYAIDQLLADTRPQLYWEKVRAGQAERDSKPGSEYGR